MITLPDLLATVEGLRAEHVEDFIARAWLTPSGEPDAWMFDETDIARARLLLLLRVELRIETDTVPVVLSLLGQLHATRWRLQATWAALEESLPADTRAEVMRRAGERGGIVRVLVHF